MIECKEYTLSQFKNILKITERQWKYRHDELLDYLKLFFDYDITTSGRGYKITIRKQYAEYEPFPRKTKMPEIKDFYKKETEEIINYKPRNTGSNIAREIVRKNNCYQHQETTAANYVRPILKQDYTIVDKDWCEINYDTCKYTPITNEQYIFLLEQFDKFFTPVRMANLLGEVESGYIDKDEYNQ